MDRLLLFSTPITIHSPDPEMEAFNSELATALIAESKQSAGIQRSNAGGWHSLPNLSLRNDPAHQFLMRHVVDKTHEMFVELSSAIGITGEPRVDWKVQAWAMVMNDGDYTVAHDHSESNYSAVYYLDAGDPADADNTDGDGVANSGALVFLDPRRGASRVAGLDLSPTNFLVQPVSGMLVLFPGWLQHYVHTYRGKRPRVAVSINLNVQIEPDVQAEV